MPLKAKRRRCRRWWRRRRGRGAGWRRRALSTSPWRRSGTSGPPSPGPSWRWGLFFTWKYVTLIPPHQGLPPSVSQGRLCFSCMNSKFGLFWRGQPCSLCSMLICGKCVNKVRFPRENEIAIAQKTMIKCKYSGLKNENKALQIIGSDIMTMLFFFFNV